MDELGVPLFQETPIDRDVYTYVYIFTYSIILYFCMRHITILLIASVSHMIER